MRSSGGGGGCILGRRPPSGRELWEGWRRQRPPKEELVAGRWIFCDEGVSVWRKQLAAMFDFVVVVGCCRGFNQLRVETAAGSDKYLLKLL